MKADELRVSNLISVKSEFGKYGYVVAIDATSGELTYRANGVYKVCSIEDVQSIPLTPGILEKAGFVFDGTYWCSQYIDIPVYPTINGGTILMAPNQKFAKEIKYLHQLQNIIHSLTGQELNIQL